MMKITLLLLMFSLNQVLALELKKVEVTLPLGLSQLDKAPLKAGDDSITYELNLYKNIDQSIIPPKLADTKTIDGFMSNLIYSYINQDKKVFKELLFEKSLAKIDLDSDKFSNSFDFLKKIKQPHLKYVYEYQDGYIVAWSAIGLITDRIIFLKKNDGKFKMHDLVIPKDDHLFWNMGLYFKFAPFDYNRPKLSNMKKHDSKYKINFEVKNFQNWIYIYSPNDKKSIIAVSDNYPNNKPYKDYDLDPRKMELKIDSNVLKKMGDDIRVVETSFPLETIPKYIHKKSIKLKLP
jgi:hypothetical protein